MPMKPLAMNAASVGVGVAGSSILSALANYAADRKDEPNSSPQAVSQAIDRARNQFGLDVGYRHSPYLMDNNAAYIPRSSVESMKSMLIPGISRTESIEPNQRKALIKRIDELVNAAGKHGILMTGRHMKKPGVVEHELGHAISSNVGSPLEKTLTSPQVSKYRTLYHTIPSYVAALLAGKRFGPAGGALAGGITGLATDAPTLYGEVMADRNAAKLTDNNEMPKSNLASLVTYLSRSGAGPALAGAVSGGLRRSIG